MKTAVLWLAFPLFPALAVSMWSQGHAPTSGSVAYVSEQRISLETAVGKAGRERVQALQRERSDDLRGKQQALESTRQQLARAQIDAAERTRLQTQEQTQRGELERAAAKAQADFQALQRQVNTELLDKLRLAVQDVVKGREIQVVLNSDTSVVWAAPPLDLSTAVIERLNAAPPPPKK